MCQQNIKPKVYHTFNIEIGNIPIKQGTASYLHRKLKKNLFEFSSVRIISAVIVVLAMFKKMDTPETC